MLRNTYKLLPLAMMLSLLTVPAKAASTLLGTSVTGMLGFTGDPSNYFDPGYGFVPAGYLNAGTPTVTISSTGIEFGYDDGASRISADFSSNQLTVSDLSEMPGANNGYQMTFSDLSFAGRYLSLVSDTMPLGGFAIANDTMTLNYPAETGVMGQTLTAVFNVAPVPEPSSLNLLCLLLGGALVTRVILAFRVTL